MGIMFCERESVCMRMGGVGGCGDDPSRATHLDRPPTRRGFSSSPSTHPLHPPPSHMTPWWVASKWSIPHSRARARLQAESGPSSEAATRETIKLARTRSRLPNGPPNILRPEGGSLLSQPRKLSSSSLLLPNLQRLFLFFRNGSTQLSTGHQNIPQGASPDKPTASRTTAGASRARCL